jgi:dTDP-4-dehydrorhamnose 3,5-epimerase
MKITTTALPDCLLFEPRRFTDARGFFQENYRADTYAAAGIAQPLVQDNWSRSIKGVLRGMHFQRSAPQGKLISVLRGKIYDVVVDIRPASSHFGQWQGLVLSEHNARQLWVPPGFAHGFLVLSEMADVHYKTSEYYQASDEGCFCWNDPDLAITWPIMPSYLSDKDATAPGFHEALA